MQGPEPTEFSFPNVREEDCQTYKNGVLGKTKACHKYLKHIVLLQVIHRQNSHHGFTHKIQKRYPPN
jgi:hypothetical protein